MSTFEADEHLRGCKANPAPTGMPKARPRSSAKKTKPRSHVVGRKFREPTSPLTAWKEVRLNTRPSLRGCHEVPHCCSRGASRSRRAWLVRRVRKEVHGELRCEGSGAVIINVDGKDYAVNGMAGPRYPPMERIWNSATQPEADIGRILQPWTDPMRLVGVCDGG